MDISKLKAADLLKLYARIEKTLQERGITRTCNNPTGDLAEYIFRKAFGWEPTGNSHPNIDAIGSDGSRYQIKARRIIHNKSRQLSAIRNFKKKHFDFLAGVLFDEDYSVMRAAIIPYDVVLKHATYQEHTNSHRFMLCDDVWAVPGVQDVTSKLRNVNL